MQANLQTKSIGLSQNSPQTENISAKVNSLWQEKKTEVQNKHWNGNKIIELSPEEQKKINHFIDEIKLKKDKKSFFSYVYKIMINIPKKEKKHFVSGVSQTLQSSSDPESIALYKKFKHSISQYMSVILASAPLMNQLRHNMGKVYLDGNDADDEIEIF